MTAPKSGFEAALTFACTDDLERSVGFYRDVLGLEPVLELSSAVLFRVTGEAYFGVTVRPPHPGGTIQEFVVANRDCVDEWYRHLARGGTPVEEPPRAFAAAGAYGFFTEDPDGNRLEFLCFDNQAFLGRGR